MDKNCPIKRISEITFLKVSVLLKLNRTAGSYSRNLFKVIVVSSFRQDYAENCRHRKTDKKRPTISALYDLRKVFLVVIASAPQVLIGQQTLRI